MVRDFMGHDNRFERTHAPLVDLKETEEEYEVKVDLPGFKKEEIKVIVSKDKLEINTKVETKEEAEEENYLHRERCARNYYRKVSFINQIDIDAVKTDLTAGVLTITLPKSEDDGKRTIEL
jgi:HSP20 family protein